MQCEFCGNDPCQCDVDQYNPVDMRAEDWGRIYADPDYDMDHDYSMNGLGATNVIQSLDRD